MGEGQITIELPEKKGDFMRINKFFTYPKAVATELFSAGWCNLDCKYCYIPKVDFIKNIHKEIIEKIKSGQFLDDLYDMFGEDLEGISHWGTEPSLTFKYFVDFYNKAVEVFPRLKEVKFSSNFMTNPKQIVEFINNLPEKLAVDMQMSLDGPEDITDKNRKLGSTSTIIKNMKYVIAELSKTNRKVKAHFKPTLAQEDLEYFSKLENLKEYYDFFDNLIGEFEIGKNINFSRSVDLTIQVPGDYKKEDGLLFTKIYENQLYLREHVEYKNITPPNSNYFYRIVRFLKFPYEFYSKHTMFTCSAGDSCFGIGENKTNLLHYCHRSFYSRHQDYLESCKEKGILPKRLYEDAVGKYILSGEHDNYDLIKYLFTSRSYHDFFINLESISYGLILFLVRNKSISKIYLDPQMAKILTFLVTTTDCFMGARALHGTSFVPNLGLFLLFGNGFGELLVKNLIKEGFIR